MNPLLPPDWRNQLQNFARQRPTALIYANPRDWGEYLGLNEEATLALIVAAAAENLVILHWDTVCQNCGFHLQSVNMLGMVMDEVVCPVCGQRGHSVLDSNVFVRVSLAGKASQSASEKRPVASLYPPLPAIRLINTPGFRSLLTHQVLPEGQSLGVQNLTIFFTDLKSSTALYHKYGDARAYAWVRDHFSVVFEATRAQGGNAIKTIGDGVMGVFLSPMDALNALENIMKGIKALNAKSHLPPEDQLKMKIGLHRGPCIVVTLNERLDYFGETVNIAARLNSAASVSTALISQSTLDTETAYARAAALGTLAPAKLALRGINLPQSVWELDLSSLV